MKSKIPGHFTRQSINSGGAKGSVYAGYIKAHYDLGLTYTLEDVAGSSAGALTAALMSVSISFDALYEHLLTTDFKALLGSQVGSFWKMIRRQSAGTSFISKDGLPMEEKIRCMLRNELIAFFQTKTGIALRSHPEIDQIAERFQEGSQDSMTFGDLYALHKVYPKKFKRLHLLATGYPNCESVILSCHATPEVDIALACHASSAIPIILNPVEIMINGTALKLIDGGYKEFLPINIFDNRDDQYFNDLPDATLLVAISDHHDIKETSIYKALHGKPPYYHPSFLEGFARKYAPQLFMQMKSPKTNIEYWEENYHQISQYPPQQVLILDTHEIIQSEFDKASFWGREITWLGYYDTLVHFHKHNLDVTKAKINIEEFFITLSRYATSIYKALLSESHINFSHDHFILNVISMKSSLAMCECFRHHIRNTAVEKLDSLQAFAFTRAIELINQKISAHHLVKEIYARIHYPERFIIACDRSHQVVYNLNAKKSVFTCPEIDGLMNGLVESGRMERGALRAMLQELDQLKNFNHAFDAAS